MLFAEGDKDWDRLKSVLCVRLTRSGVSLKVRKMRTFSFVLILIFISSLLNLPFPARGGADETSSHSPDSLFTTSFSNLSLNKLKYVLPSFIQVMPESRLTGTLRWTVQGFSQLRVDADVLITDVRINHPGLSSLPVTIPDLFLKGTITWNHSQRIISFADLYLGRKGVMVRATGQISYLDATVVSLNLSLSNTAIQNLLDALPADLIPNLQGAKVAGTIAMDTTFFANPRYPKLARFEPGIKISDYNLLKEPPGLGIEELKSDFVCSARKKGVVVRQILLSKSNPQFVPYDDLGENVRQAILMSEDRDFFYHHGFSLEAIRNALVHNISAQGYVVGGSTITQQVAKNLFLDGQRTLSRKLQEAVLTYALEQELSKERVFEIYANIIEWGVDVYGISEATRHYFSKIPSSLTGPEAARLASIIPNPHKRDFNKFQ